MNITTLVEPAGEPVSMDAVKAFLRIDYEGEDTKVSSLISSARARIEVETGLCLVQRTAKIEVSDWSFKSRNELEFELSIGPVSSIVSVLIDGVDHTQRFVLKKGRPDTLKFRGAFLPYIHEMAEFTFVSGFGPDDSYVPADLKLAVKLLVAESYAQGEAGSDLSNDVSVLLAPWRRVSL